MQRNKNLRPLRTHVTAQTRGNLERLAAMSGYGNVGRVVDKLVRDRMVELRIVLPKGCNRDA